jgi:hypothetical protein
MSFIKTKLTVKDKQILSEIYDNLEEIILPTSYSSKGVKGHHHCVKTGTTDQKDARQVCFGKVKYKGTIQESSYSKKYPHMFYLFKKFINSHYPSFKFRSVYVNKNTVCKKHLDSKNVGESLLVGFGKYTGGQTMLYTQSDDKPKSFHIKTNSLIFNGSEIPHKSEPFKGTRYSLVFFQ